MTFFVAIFPFLRNSFPLYTNTAHFRYPSFLRIFPLGRNFGCLFKNLSVLESVPSLPEKCTFFGAPLIKNDIYLYKNNVHFWYILENICTQSCAQCTLVP